MSINPMTYRKIIIICFLLVGAGLFFWWFAKNHKTTDNVSNVSTSTPLTKNTEEVSEKSDYALVEKYTNGTFHFSFNYPKVFKITEKNDAGGQTIIVTNPSNSSHGFQVAITPFSDPVNTLTKETIETDIPDLFITDVLKISIDSVAKGLMFESDNPDFDSSSREVWFIYKGNLYQMSTYLKNDILVRKVMETWEFK